MDNPDLRLELTANGELITMVPVAIESSEQNGLPASIPVGTAAICTCPQTY